MILDRILATKRDEIARARASQSLAEVIAQANDADPARPFALAITRPDQRLGLIAEVKKASPSAGVIRADFHPESIAHAYEDGGAHCLSVLTDESYFQGSLATLSLVRRSVKLPCLRKDFVIDSYQVYEARAAGADAILLIVAALSPGQLSDLSALAASLAMTVLIEVHDEAEMAIGSRCALDLPADLRLIGINNRDLKSFTVSLDVTERLAQMAPKGIPVVSESGIKNSRDVERVRAAGASAVLVGEALMQTQDIARAARSLMSAA